MPASCFCLTLACELWCGVFVLLARVLRQTGQPVAVGAGKFSDSDAQLIQVCMPHLRTVLASIERKIRFSTRRPIMMTVKSPAKTDGISSWFLAS
jgi:hypothetical protein